MAKLTGTKKNDLKVGTDTPDLIEGLSGDDTLAGGGGDDSVYGGVGNDLLFGFREYSDNEYDSQGLATFGDDIDYLYGGAGNDLYVMDALVSSGQGKVIIVELPGEGTDTIIANVSKKKPSYTIPDNVENCVNDTTLSDNGSPLFVEITGNSLNNLIQTSPASWSNLKKITSGINETKASCEKFDGDQGDDTLKSGAGNDSLEGGSGNDSLLAGTGDDTLVGGSGIDQLSGGIGADVFVFSSGDCLASGKVFDQIKDFKFTEGDQIKLDGMANIKCHVRDFKEKSVASALVDANKDFQEGLNVSIQFVASNGLMCVDFDENGSVDGVVILTGLKAGNEDFVDYAEGGSMFA